METSITAKWYYNVTNTYIHWLNERVRPISCEIIYNLQTVNVIYNRLLNYVRHRLLLYMRLLKTIMMMKLVFFIKLYIHWQSVTAQNCKRSREWSSDP